MKGIKMGRIGPRLAVVATAALALASCSEKEAAREKPAVKRYTVPASLDRELNNAELDSLSRMKRTHNITRDEYWDGYGGVLANDVLEVWYPDGKLNAMQGMAMMKLASEARARTQRVFGVAPAERAVIICAGDIDVYTSSTGREWWHYSRIVGDTISIQPPINLHTRGILTVVGPREYYEWAIGKISKGHAPRWIEEGLASYLAGEAAVLEELRVDTGDKPIAMSTKDMESALEKENDRQETRRAYYNAYRTVEQIVKAHGEEAMGRFVVALGGDDNLDAASQAAFGAKFGEVAERAHAWARAE
ncbi:MAG TPA: hypothetical protein VEC56_02570 [Candidatus Krumholzibacteria bacterium]|nr:hypothetical protein [Candidatus Krumholzibacteria bacterium]